jgi:hypothetical protein
LEAPPRSGAHRLTAPLATSPTGSALGTRRPRSRPRLAGSSRSTVSNLGAGSPVRTTIHRRTQPGSPPRRSCSPRRKRSKSSRPNASFTPISLKALSGQPGSRREPARSTASLPNGYRVETRRPLRLRYGRGVTWRYERSGGILRTTVLLATIAVAVLTVAPASLASTAQLSFSPGVVTLGSVRVRTTTEQAVTLTNAGEKSVTLSGFSAFGFNGTFMVNPGTCSLGRTLAPGESARSASLPHPSSSARSEVSTASRASARAAAPWPAGA